MLHSFKSPAAMSVYGQDALDALSGVGISLLTNHDYCYKHRPDGDEPRDCGCNKFWWTSRQFKKRYKQENAKVGDTFVDGNNGDKHEVLAVDLENSRLAYRNLDQCESILMIACW